MKCPVCGKDDVMSHVSDWYIEIPYSIGTSDKSIGRANPSRWCEDGRGGCGTVVSENGETIYALVGQKREYRTQLILEMI